MAAPAVSAHVPAPVATVVAPLREPEPAFQTRPAPAAVAAVVAPALAAEMNPWGAEASSDPWKTDAPARSKPLVVPSVPPVHAALPDDVLNPWGTPQSVKSAGLSSSKAALLDDLDPWKT